MKFLNYLRFLFLILFNISFCNALVEKPKTNVITNLEIIKTQQLDVILEHVLENKNNGYSDNEVTNLIEAIELIKDLNLVNKSKKDITLDIILNLHKIILKNINNENAGKFRKVTVSIENSTFIFPLPEEVENLMKEFIIWLHETKDDPIDIILNAHIKFVNIHPFYDGNGRMARLIMNILLIQHGFAAIVLDINEREKYLDAIKNVQLNKDYSKYYDFYLKN